MPTSFQGESNQGVPDLGKKKNQLELGQPGEVESRASLDRHCGPGWLGWKELGSAGVTEELPMSSAARICAAKSVMAFWVDDTQWKEPTQKGIAWADLCVLQKNSEPFCCIQNRKGGPRPAFRSLKEEMLFQ